jgi:glycosyltransferase involved in cell wall biosynthesis
MTETAKSLDRSIFVPHVGCFHSGMRGDELRDFGVTVIRWPVTSFGSMSAVRGARDIARYIRSQGIRIVHTWDYPLNLIAIPPARMLTRAVAISSQRSHRALIPPFYRRLMKVSDLMSHAIVVNCEDVRRHLIEERVPPRKIRVCYNGIDFDRFRRLPRQENERCLTIGVICALRPEKDLGTLIDAFAFLRDIADLKLVIVGSGDQLPFLERHVRDAGVDDRCHFEPATAEVAEWLSKMDIFVLTSRSEALSNALMEAMACGCCVIASDVGGNSELVHSGETGILFPAGDAAALAAALRSVILDRGLRQRLAESGQSFIRDGFSAAASAVRMRDIYLDLLDEPHGPDSTRKAP